MKKTRLRRESLYVMEGCKVWGVRNGWGWGVVVGVGVQGECVG